MTLAATAAAHARRWRLRRTWRSVCGIRIRPAGVAAAARDRLWRQRSRVSTVPAAGPLDVAEACDRDALGDPPLCAASVVGDFELAKAVYDWAHRQRELSLTPDPPDQWGSWSWRCPVCLSRGYGGTAPVYCGAPMATAP